MDHEDEIRRCAYELWEKEGSPHGRDAEFWERARLLVEAKAAPAGFAPPQQSSAEENAVDKAMMDSFPASDPPSFTPTGGAGDTDDARDREV